MGFVNLHVHTEYSLLDGACRIRDVMQRVKELGQDSIAITDHGVMYGVIDFYNAALDAGIKPIIGCEVYVAPRSRFDKLHGTDNEACHLVLLCENEIGYKNLCYLVSCGHTEGFYIRPRVDMQLLREHSEGLIALSACLAGRIPRLILQDDYDGALAAAKELSEVFGKDRFYLELQDHGIPEQRTVNAQILRIASETGLPLVATNDAHYLRKEDAAMQDVLLCVQTGKTLDEENRMRFETQEFYLKSEEEMRALFPQTAEAIDNTCKIAERCNMNFTFGKYHLPEFKLPEGYDSLSYLRELCDKGFAERYGDAHPEYREQLEYEIKMIDRMGFTDYFLIVSDFVRFAKDAKIPVGPGRGSAAGSMVSYTLHITDIDPMQYSLYFERFLNPERISMPDIDMDFGDTRRGEVVDYVRKKYGEDHVAQIVTFGTMAARGAIRDVGRVMDFSYAETDVVAKLVPSAPHMTLDDALVQSPQLKTMYDTDERVKMLVDTARAIEGMPRNTSTHAAGVVITKNPVYDYVPLSTNDGVIVTQYTMTTLERLGLLKMDFLGLRNLTVIDDAVKEIRRAEPEFTMASIRDDDPETFAMLSRGRTAGVFQLESAGITAVCTQMKPQSIEDMTAIVALYRPGPMDSIPRFIQSKMHPETISYKHPLLEPILAVTYGCIVYQEQVIEIFRKLGGFSLGQADNMRRAISKKKQDVIKAERQAFIYGDEARGICGALKNGVPEQVAQSVYDEILDFANYAFNKAHAVSYAKVSYDTAYLKCHYPRQYMAALMTSVLDSTDKISFYRSECKELGIPVLPPDVNESEDFFTVVPKGIRFGLAAVKNIGRGFVQTLSQERQENGLFRSLEDFCRRMNGQDLNKRAMENLIKCGACDCFGLKRSQMLRIYESVMDAEASFAKRNGAGQLSLFDDDSDVGNISVQVPDIPELDARERMHMEKEAAGMYFSGHPLEGQEELLRRLHVTPIREIMESMGQSDGRFRDGQNVTVAGVVQAVKLKSTRSNSMMAYVTLEDDGGSVETLVFSSVLGKTGTLLREDAMVLLDGRISVRDDKDPQLVVNEVRELTQDLLREAEQKGSAAPTRKRLYLRIPSEESREFAVVKAVLEMFPGETQIVLFFSDTRLRRAAKASIAEPMLDQMRELLGDVNVVLADC